MSGITIPFDTLAFVKELEIGGFPAQQAEAQARALATVLKKVEDSRELATKADLQSTKSEIIRWTAGMFIAQTALLVGALFAMMKLNQPAPPPPQPAPVVQSVPAPLQAVPTPAMPIPATPRPPAPPVPR